MGSARRITCRQCGAAYDTDGSNDGRPYGLITVSVNVPPVFGMRGKPYLYVGMFCSVDCLELYLPQIDTQIDQIAETVGLTPMEVKSERTG